MAISKMDKFYYDNFYGGTLETGYDYFGAHIETRLRKKGVMFRVWAPNAEAVSVVGDFNAWNPEVNKLEKIKDSSVWEVFVPAVNQFDNYKYQTLVEENDLLKKITVKDSKIKELKITAKEKVTKYLKNDYDKTKINITYKGKEEINFKDKKGDKIGEIIVKYDDKLVKNIDVLLEEDIKFSLYNHIIQSKIRIGAVISIILLSIILIIKKMR